MNLCRIIGSNSVGGWEHDGAGGRRVYTKERKNAEYVKYSVPIGEREAVHVDAQPDMENCSNGLAPQPNAAADGVRRMKVPVVQTMTK